MCKTQETVKRFSPRLNGNIDLAALPLQADPPTGASSRVPTKSFRPANVLPRGAFTLLYSYSCHAIYSTPFTFGTSFSMTIVVVTITNALMFPTVDDCFFVVFHFLVASPLELRLQGFDCAYWLGRTKQKKGE